MIVFPNAKINIGLQVRARRSDGFHDIETVFYAVPWCDALEAQRLEDNATGKIDLACTGLSTGIPAERNLCFRAYELLDGRFGLPPVRMHLHKAIPSGAGLGGGSSDAAHALLLLNDLCDLALPEPELRALALSLGSDCPFFIGGTPCFAEGRGERMTPLALDLGGWHVVVVKPPQSVETAWAYAQVTPSDDRPSLRDAVSGPVASWRNTVTNDFEQVVFDAWPAIRGIRDSLYDAGAVYAAMTGSGSAVYGLFERAPVWRAFPGMIAWQGVL